MSNLKLWEVDNSTIKFPKKLLSYEGSIEIKEKENSVFDLKKEQKKLDTKKTIFDEMKKFD